MNGNIIKLIENVVKDFLNEISFHDIKIDDILTDKYVRNYILNGYADNLLDYYKDENNLDNRNDDDVLESEEFFDLVKSELESNLNVAMDNIYDNIDNQTNKIKLYRAIRVDNNWLNHLKTQGKRLGIYWTWNENSAETHWGDYSKENEALIEIEIDEKYINWYKTLEMNMNSNFHEENEIRLFKNTPIKLKSIKINDVDMDISELINKTFYA